MRYPAYKYIIILIVLLISTIYALPNFYPDEPAVQISGAKAGTQLDASVLSNAQNILQQAGITTHKNTFTAKSALLRVNSSIDQLKAQDILKQKMGDDYVIALNLAPTTPQWLLNLGAKPMKLGLDLRGGVHFLLEVDIDKALAQRIDSSLVEIRKTMREQKVNFNSLKANNSSIEVVFDNAQDAQKAEEFAKFNFRDFTVKQTLDGTVPTLVFNFSEAKKLEITQYAVGQNLVTMRNRINELGVAEAVVQTQGANRIVVDLPGVQDTAAAKRVLGRTANLEFRLVDEQTMPESGFAPSGTEAFAMKTVDGPLVLLKRQRILTGDRVQHAQSSMGDAGPEVNVNLDNQGGKLLSAATQNAVGKQMAVLFIENKQKSSFSTNPTTGKVEEVRTPIVEKVIISKATIQAVLGSQFRITGLDSSEEAAELALLLRAGALAAPMYFVEERTIGPSLGQENIDKGVTSALVGFGLVALFMLVFYKLFGLMANIALALNVAMILAIMSMIGSALSLPGIAGIVLTLGMAVDANVLIFERIKEEMRRGANAKSAILAGFDRAYGTILDANITTLLVALVLFLIGTGPIKGFAVTLSIGILCSMFTAITVTRACVQIVYGKQKHINKLSI